MRSVRFRLVIPVFSLLLASACLYDSEIGQAQHPPKQEKPATAAKTLTPESLPEVVARVNGQEVKKSELLMKLRMNETQMMQSGQQPPEDRTQILRQTLDEIISSLLLFQEGKARGYTATDAEVEEQISEIKKRFPNDQAFASALKAQGIALDQLQQELRLNLTIRKFIDKDIRPKVDVNEAEVKAFYDGNQDKLKEPEQVRASHILIRADEKNKDRARKKAEEILKQAKSGADFAELAKANSDDPGSKAQGGDLGYFPQGTMVPAFEQAAFALKAGEISGIVETQFGFHIIKLTDRKAARTVPFEEVKDQIKNFLSQNAVRDKVRATIDELRAKGKIEILI